MGSPDFPPKSRDRRGSEAAVLTPFAHMQSLARRVESSIRNSWDLVPGVRRITMKWHSAWHSDLWRRLKGKRAELKETPDHAWVEAAQGLYKKLQKGVRPCAAMCASQPTTMHEEVVVRQ